MAERNQQQESHSMEDELTGKGFGKQGVDKAPGEEPAQHKTEVIPDTQKAKGKVDGDPLKKSDQPAAEEI